MINDRDAIENEKERLLAESVFPPEHRWNEGFDGLNAFLRLLGRPEIPEHLRVVYEASNADVARITYLRNMGRGR